jgi:hypothetical protein
VSRVMFYRDRAVREINHRRYCRDRRERPGLKFGSPWHPWRPGRHSRTDGPMPGVVERVEGGSSAETGSAGAPESGRRTHDVGRHKTFDPRADPSIGRPPETRSNPRQSPSSPGVGPGPPRSGDVVKGF